MANAVEMSTMRKLVAQLNQYRHEYYNLNAPSVADDVYDYMNPSVKADFFMQKALSPCCWLPIWTRFIPIGRISSAAPRMDAT